MRILVLLAVLNSPASKVPPRPLPALDTTFYDGNWRHVGRANAVYYGLVTPLDSGRCRIQDFYLTGERQMEASGYLGPPVVKDGPVTYYFRSGAKRTTGLFVNGKHEGNWYYWQEDGTLRRKMRWHAGVAVPTPSQGQKTDPADQVPQFVRQMPKFPGSLSVVQYLEATMHKPADAPPGGGKVFVQFVVGPQGNITSTRIIKGFDPACDAEALRAVAALPRWQPGRQNDKPVAVRFVIPITFQ